MQRLSVIFSNSANGPYESFKYLILIAIIMTIHWLEAMHRGTCGGEGGREESGLIMFRAAKFLA